MTILGAVFLPQQPPELLRSTVRAAEEAGLEELWLWEDCFLESGVATAAAALAWTERLRVGIGVLPAPLRNVALTAMEAATLHRMFPGRLHLGIGHGVQDWMEQVGGRVPSPLTLLGEYATALRGMLAGAEISVEGRYVRLDRVALDWPPSRPAPVLVGTSGVRSLRLAGEVADGTILHAGTDADGVRAARRHIDDGRRAAGRTDPHPVTVYLLALDGRGAGQLAGEVGGLATAGADRVVLQPAGAGTDPEAFVRFVAREVRPLVQ